MKSQKKPMTPIKILINEIFMGIYKKYWLVENDTIAKNFTCWKYGGERDYKMGL